MTNTDLSSSVAVVDYLQLRNTLLLTREHFGRYAAFIRFTTALLQLVSQTLRPARRPLVFHARARLLALRDHLRGCYGPPPATCRIVAPVAWSTPPPPPPSGPNRSSSTSARAERAGSACPRLPSLPTGPRRRHRRRSPRSRTSPPSTACGASPWPACCCSTPGSRGPSGGYLGVSTFFTLSGYLITTLLLAEHGRTGRRLAAGLLEPALPAPHARLAA